MTGGSYSHLQQYKQNEKQQQKPVMQQKISVQPKSGQ